MTGQERDAIRTRLQELETAKGQLTPEVVLADARKADSPLHSQFEWDTKKAAKAYWLEQARELIRSVRMVMRDESTSLSVVAYVRDPRADSDEQGYISIRKLLTEKDLARDAVVNEFSRAAAGLRRAREIAAALNLAGEVDGIIDHIETVKAKAQEQPGA